MSADTIGWRDITLSWLSGRSHDLADTLELLFDKYIPQVVDFIRPVLSNSVAVKTDSDSALSVGENVPHGLIEPQDLMLSEVHVANTCCQILEVRTIAESLYMHGG